MYTARAMNRILHFKICSSTKDYKAMLPADGQPLPSAFSNRHRIALKTCNTNS